MCGARLLEPARGSERAAKNQKQGIMAKTAKSGRKAAKPARTGKAGRKPKAAPKPKAKKTKRLPPRKRPR